MLYFWSLIVCWVQKLNHYNNTDPIVCIECVHNCATMDEEFQILIEYVIMSFDCYEFIVVCEEFEPFPLPWHRWRRLHWLSCHFVVLRIIHLVLLCSKGLYHAKHMKQQRQTMIGLSLWFLTCLWFALWSFDKISFDDPPTCDLASSNLLLSGMDQIVIGATCENMLVPATPFDVVFNCTCNGWQGFC